MLTKLIIGILTGTLAGLGIGGGSLLMLWLTIIENADAQTARGINLMFFIVAASSVAIIRRRKGNTHLTGIAPAAVSGCMAAAICSVIGQNIDGEILRKILGILFLITGTRELLYRPAKAK